jgi:hypothetical protein
VESSCERSNEPSVSIKCWETTKAEKLVASWVVLNSTELVFSFLVYYIQVYSCHHHNSEAREPHSVSFPLGFPGSSVLHVVKHWR